MDATDKKILTLLQENARISNAEIARTIGLAPSAIHERIKKLEKTGLILQYRTVVDRASLDYKLLAFVFITTNENAHELDVAQRIADFPEVLEMHNIAGDDSFLAKMVFKDPQSMAVKLRERFRGIDAEVKTRSVIVLESIKEDSMVPINAE